MPIEPLGWKIGLSPTTRDEGRNVVMMGGNKHRNWFRAVLILTVLSPPTVASAELPRPLELAGRCCGVCWGDGYHACSSSGIRPGADIPPKSFSATQHANMRTTARRFADYGGATYYDQFDAANGRPCDGPGCLGTTTITNIYGSQVMQQSEQVMQQPEASWADLANPTTLPDTIPILPGRSAITNPLGTDLPGVAATSTPSAVDPVHPGENPVIERPYSTIEPKVKNYPKPLPSLTPLTRPDTPDSPQTLQTLRPPQQLRPAKNLIVPQEGLGLIQSNPFVGGSAVEVARQPSDFRDLVIRQPL